ncbi:MAG TPA: amidohydrolase family protein [Vicinamibacterales bacterium]|nr:amidohydrolase family protein [Vicinamibacterales bacterium]
MSRKVWMCVLLGAVGAAQPDAGQAHRFDVVLKNGTILDGSGLPPYRADVAIAGGRIARIGNLPRDSAEHDIDVTGLYVAPGFINIHSHLQPAALPRAENMLTQGVTTEITNADGAGPTDLRTVTARVARAGLSVNLGAYIGFNSVWSAVVGLSDRRPTAEEIDRMRALIVAAMKAGAWGVSAGLEYRPGYFARTEEVTQVVSAAAPWRTNFPNHVRKTPESGFSWRVGLEETLRIAKAAGLIGVITHMKAEGKEQGTATRLLATVAASTREGDYAAADVYPYLSGQTRLSNLIIPAWVQDGGRQAMLERFADPDQRPRIAREIEQTIAGRLGDVAGIYLPETRRHLTDVMRQMEVSAGEAVVRLVEKDDPQMIAPFGRESDLQKILEYPDTSIACDCGATNASDIHPRFYGSFPRVLGKYVREEKILTWQDAVRKMTALPAATIGMIDRGYLAPGMAADVTVFDPRTVVDRATYEKPAVLSEGIRHVFVNGVHAVRDGVVTGEQGGRVLWRTDAMPSRPMTANGRRRVTLRTQTETGEISIDIRQERGARYAQGTVVMRAGDAPVVAGELGVLQVAPGWASFTAENMHAVIDAANPLTPGSARLNVWLRNAEAPHVSAVDPAKVRVTLPQR